MSSTSDLQSSPRAKRVLISIVLSALALTLSGTLYMLLLSLRPPLAAREPVEKTFNIEVFAARAADLEEIISGFGTAEASQEVIVSAQVAGEVLAIHPALEIGTRVTAPDVVVDDTGRSQRLSGDVLVRIDQRTNRQRAEQAESRLAESASEIAALKQELTNNARLLEKARDDLVAVQVEYDRIVRAREQNVASVSEVTRSLLELQQYRDSVLQLETQRDLLPLRIEAARRRQETTRRDLEMARLDLEYTEVRPPFSGRISEVMTDVGQYLRLGEHVVRLTDLQFVQVPVPLPLHDFLKLETKVLAGEQPPVELAANETDRPRWFGRLVRVAPEADARTRTVRVFIEVDNRSSDTPLLPGTFVHARIPGPLYSEVIAIPRDAITGGVVFVVRDGTVETRQVEVERTLQTISIISSGIRAGDDIVLTNLDMMRDGVLVDVQRRRVLSDELRQQRTRFARLAGTTDGDGARVRIN